MEIVIVEPNFDNKDYRSKDLWINRWLDHAKWHNCDKITFMLTDKPVGQHAETVSLKKETKKSAAFPCDPIRERIFNYLVETFPECPADEHKRIVENSNAIDMAETSTGDGKHMLKVVAFLDDLTVVYFVDNKPVHVESFPSPGLMAYTLASADYDSLVATAEQWFLPTVNGEEETK